MNPSIARVAPLLLLILSGCAASTLNNAIDNGAIQLNNEEIFSMTSGNTLRLVSSDFDSYVFFSPSGPLSASSIFAHSLDSGRWDIKSDSKLCIKYSLWYYGDTNCYVVYREGEQSNTYLLFTDNGSLAFTGTHSIGNSQGLKVKSPKDGKPVYVRSQIQKGQETAPPSSSAASQRTAAPLPETTHTGPGASSEEISHTVKSMARDCPGCNFEEADLRKANLIGANLKDANLKGADLSRANLRRANLEGADLRGATLLTTNLPGANLKGADLTGADLSGSNLIQADFTDATLDNAILDNTLREGTKGLK